MRFTAETAAEYGRKGAATANAKRRQAAEAIQALATIPPPADNGYVERRLARVRLQIERLSDLMDKESDPRMIERYSAALERLSKLEQTLAGRPGPGNRKPAPDRPNKRNLAPLPQPVVEEPPRQPDPNEPNG